MQPAGGFGQVKDRTHINLPTCIYLRTYVATHVSPCITVGNQIYSSGNIDTVWERVGRQVHLGSSEAFEKRTRVHCFHRMLHQNTSDCMLQCRRSGSSTPAAPRIGSTPCNSWIVHDFSTDIASRPSEIYTVGVIGSHDIPEV